MKYFFLVIFLFLVWRILLFLPLLYAESHIPMQTNSFQYTLWAYAGKYPPVDSFLLYPWSNFDGVHYLTIAGDGGFLKPFGYQEGSDGRFFPLYPLLIAFCTFLLGQDTVFGIKVFFSAFILSNILFFFSLILLYKLTRLDFSKKIAFFTLVFLCCFPVSFFYGAIYTESLFLFLTLATFYALRKKLFLLASLAALCLVATRIVGIFIVPFVWYEIWKDDIKLFLNNRKKPRFFPLIGKLFISLCIPLGLVAFSWYSWYEWRDPLFFIHAQQNIGDGRNSHFILFPQTIYRYFKILLTVKYFTFPWSIALLELGSFLFTAIFLYIAYKKHVPKLYVFFSTVIFLAAADTGTFSGLPRYVMVFFPLFMGLALIKKPYIQILYILIGIISLFFLTAFFAKGYLVS